MAERVKSIKGLSIDPEVLKLAEDEIAVKFMEHPEIESEVREKVSGLIENPNGRQIVESKDAIKYLKRNLGTELAAIMCSINDVSFASFGRAKNPKKPSTIQNHNIAAAYVILDILLSQLTRQAAVDWLTGYSEYLYGVPAVEIHRRPEDVRMAALNRIMGGEEPAAVF